MGFMEEAFMPYDLSTSIGEFLSAAASKQPIPGGGSIAALAGALGASMGEMVVNYSVGKKSLAAHQPQLEAALVQFHKARMMLLELMVEDQLAYQALTDAKKAPEGSPQRAAVVELSISCVSIPLTVAATAVAIIELSEKVARIANPYLLSDLAVCADLAMATVRCAGYNVRVNLPELSSDIDRKQSANQMESILFSATMAVQKASAAIWQKD